MAKKTVKQTEGDDLDYLANEIGYEAVMKLHQSGGLDPRDKSYAKLQVIIEETVKEKISNAIRRE